MAERLSAQWPETGAGINDLEDLAGRMGQDVHRELSEWTLPEAAERKEGNQSACRCGNLPALPWPHGGDGCRESARTACLLPRRPLRPRPLPADGRLCLGPSNTTPTAQARLAVRSALEPYVQVPDLLAQLGLPLALDLKSTQRVTQDGGARVAAARLRPHPKATRPVAVGFDGVMIPTREGYKEARVGVIYEPDWTASRTPAGEASRRKEYFATTGSRESLVARVCARARERAAGAVGLL